MRNSEICNLFKIDRLNEPIIKLSCLVSGFNLC